MKNWIVLPLVLLAGISLAFAVPRGLEEETKDEKAVRAAITDYVLGFYEADTERLERALSKDLKKMGYWRAEEDADYSGPLHMSYEQALDLASKWNAEGQQGDDLKYSVELYEVMDKTACAKVTAKWGMDYFQLAKEGEHWKIHHVLWQSAPR